MTDVFARVCGRLEAGELPSRRDIASLIALRGDGQAHLFSLAARARDRRFGRSVFLYGFLYLSTHCRNDCAFCHFRRANAGLARYRKDAEATLAAARRLAGDGVHLLDLTLGEDPHFLRPDGMRELCGIVRSVKRETGLPVMLSPGLLTAEQLALASAAGADWYACYQETHNEDLFARLRPGQDYAARLRAKTLAVEADMLAEEGILTGAGASPDDVAASVLHMARSPLAQVRAMSYVPHPVTLPAADAEESQAQELNAIAVMRLCMPDRLIPASLDVDGLRGMAARLAAGANVVTSIIPSGFGLSGVASETDIDTNLRDTDGVRAALEELGYAVADLSAYESWIEERKQRQRRQKGLCA